MVKPYWRCQLSTEEVLRCQLYPPVIADAVVGIATEVPSQIATSGIDGPTGVTERAYCMGRRRSLSFEITTAASMALDAMSMRR